jgi:LuxR family transcriptional regulator, maltose regulon positive regulatory protein
MERILYSPVDAAAPRLSSTVVDRPQLRERLRQLPRITLICAAAGFGKTTLAAQLTADRPLTLWLTLNEDSDDPIQLILRLTGCFGSRLAAVATVIGLARDRRDWQAALRVLIDGLAALTEPVTLVLDDVQWLRQPASLALLAELLEHSPSTLHWLVLSRRQPQLPFSRPPAAGELIEITDDDLRADAALVSELGRRFDLTIDMPAAEALAERSQGWFAGLQLALLAARRDAVAQSADLRGYLSGADSYLADYLISEVLTQLPVDRQEFLLRCSVVPRLHAGLCAAVSGRSDAVQLLQEIVEQNLFVRPLVGSAWYHMHGLFAEVLQRELPLRLGQAELSACYRRAAAWYAQQDDLPAALRSLRAGGLIDEAVQLLARHAWQYLLRAQAGELLRLLQFLPEAAVEAAADLLLPCCWAMFVTRDDDGFQRMLTLLGRLTLTPQQDDDYAALLLLVRYLMADHGTLCADSLQRLAQLQRNSDHARGWICLIIAMTHRPQVTGEKHPIRFLEQAGSAFQRCGALYAETYLTGLSAALWRNLGHPDECLAYCRNTLAYVGRHLSLYMAAEAHYTLRIVAAEQLYWRGDIAQTVEHLTALGELLQTPSVIGTLGRLEVLLRLDACARLQPLPPPAEALRTTLRGDAAQLWEDLWLSGARTLVAACLQLEFEQYWRDGQQRRIAAPLQRLGLQLSGLDDQSPDVFWLILLTGQVALHEHLEQLTAVFDQQLARTKAVGSRLLHLRLLLLAALHAHALSAHLRARRLFRSALQTARKLGYRRMILDLPEVLPLLRSAGNAYADQLADELTMPPLKLPDIDFTLQEQRVISLLRRGADQAQIGRELAITTSTVKWHLSRVYAKLGVHSRAEALARLNGGS